MSSPRLAGSQRARLCDLLSDAGPGAPTLCVGWLTGDLAAHLYVREHQPLAAAGIRLGGRFARRNAEAMASSLRRFGYAGVVARVRAGPPLLWRPVDEPLNLVEYFVHAEDVRRAKDGRTAVEDPALDAALWSGLRRSAPLLRLRLRSAGLELDWPGHGSVVVRRGEPMARLSGGPQELVLYMTGRREAAAVVLSGSAEARSALEKASLGI